MLTTLKVVVVAMCVVALGCAVANPEHNETLFHKCLDGLVCGALIGVVRLLCGMAVSPNPWIVLKERGLRRIVVDAKIGLASGVLLGSVIVCWDVLVG